MLSDTPTLSGAVGILGSGDFARALATRCLDRVIEVTVGSRNPEKRRHLPNGDILTKVKVDTVETCIKTNDVIFVALHPKHHSSLAAHADLLQGKVLVDVSNSLTGGKESHAQTLAALLPHTHVVKGFNTVSAYALMTDDPASVHICADDQTAKAMVMAVASRLGLSPVDAGPLSRALTLEKSNRGLFPGWGGATIVTFVQTVIWTVLAMLRYFDWRNPPYTWERLPTNVVNKIVGCVSLTSLCLVYLPGVFAGFTQLCWGTKHRRFNRALASWLDMRKQIGLYALLFGVLHTIMSMVLLSPAYYSKWYLHKSYTVPANHSLDVVVSLGSRMNAAGETCVLLGVLAITSMAVLGVTSLPSIAKSMNWREWRFIQSYLGFACLVLATAHLTVKGGASWVTADSYKDYLPTVTFFALPLPWFTVFLRIMLYLPCFHYQLQKIRAGWERGATDKVAVTVEMGPAGPSGKYTKQTRPADQPDEILNIGTVNEAYNGQ